MTKIFWVVEVQVTSPRQGKRTRTDLVTLGLDAELFVVDADVAVVEDKELIEEELFTQEEVELLAEEGEGVAEQDTEQDAEQAVEVVEVIYTEEAVLTSTLRLGTMMLTTVAYLS